MLRKLFAVLALLTLVTGGLSAAQAAASYETFIDQKGKGDSYEASVSFQESCGEECQVASLGCGPGPGIVIDYSGFADKAAASLIVRSKRHVAITVVKTTYQFDVMKIIYEGDMTGDWTIEGELLSQSPDFLSALAKAKAFTVAVGGRSVTLPVSKDVVTWAKSCPK